MPRRNRHRILLHNEVVTLHNEVVAVTLVVYLLLSRLLRFPYVFVIERNDRMGKYCILLHNAVPVIKCACFVLSLLFPFVLQIRFGRLVAC